MGRLHQLFTAPGPEEDTLPTPASAWHTGRYVTIPMEHWDLILDFAEKLDTDKAQILRRYAYPPNTRWLLPPTEELESMLVFLKHLQEEILKAPPFVTEPSDRYPEDFPNDEHVRMVDAVVAVLLEVRRLGQPFEGDADA